MILFISLTQLIIELNAWYLTKRAKRILCIGMCEGVLICKNYIILTACPVVRDKQGKLLFYHKDIKELVEIKRRMQSSESKCRFGSFYKFWGAKCYRDYHTTGRYVPSADLEFPLFFLSVEIEKSKYSLLLLLLKKQKNDNWIAWCQWKNHINLQSFQWLEYEYEHIFVKKY